MAVTIHKGRALDQLNLTPLIDCVFLLLIFFLVATKFAEEERELDVMLPQASEARPLIDRPREMFINIDHSGRYYMTGKILTLDEMQAVLNQRFAELGGGAAVIIRADKRAQWEYVVAAMNACNKAGIRDYKVSTLDK